MRKSFLSKVGIVSCVLMTTVFAVEDKKQELHVLKSINGYPLETLKKAEAVASYELIEDTNCIAFHIDESGALKVGNTTIKKDFKAQKVLLEESFVGGRMISKKLTMKAGTKLSNGGICEGTEEITLSAGTEFDASGISLYRSQGPISVSSPLYLFGDAYFDVNPKTTVITLGGTKDSIVKQIQLFPKKDTVVVSGAFDFGHTSFSDFLIINAEVKIVF